MALKRRLKLAFLALSRALGLFALARRLTANQLRILCYHGFVRLGDESRFRPPLFMRRATFAARLEHLRRQAYPVLDIDEALERLAAGILPPRATVITLDDGFHSVLSEAWPELERRGLPATLYVTTYYVRKQLPVFRLVLQYLIWRSRQPELALDGLGRWPLGDAQQKEDAAMALMAHGEAVLDEAGRQALLERLATALGEDMGSLRSTRAFAMLTEDEIRELETRGLRIELHTHRHRFPADSRELAEREIADNRAVLEPLAGRPLTHFCYPSGEWQEHQAPWLDALGVYSSTTCLPGLNDRNTPRHALRRQLDAEDLSLLEFEAELSGFLPGLRGFLSGAG
ncbi:MAG: polysaccharide deacetylase family protein [Gammaproteobacteria bacterium]|nr:polysaccharide deacetylase family protein [Gammaproteobacteria bacterium]